MKLSSRGPIKKLAYPKIQTPNGTSLVQLIGYHTKKDMSAALIEWQDTYGDIYNDCHAIEAYDDFIETVTTVADTCLPPYVPGQRKKIKSTPLTRKEEAQRLRSALS